MDAVLKADGSNAVCLVGVDDYDEVSEMVLLTETRRHGEEGNAGDDAGDAAPKPVRVLQTTDAIMMEDINLSQLPEFRFPGGDWRVSCAGADAVRSWRDSKFGQYEKDIRTCPPKCLSGLGKMLHLGPVTKLFGRADDPLFPMTDEEKARWTVVPKDGSGKATHLPWQLGGLRSWDPVTRSYSAIDIRLKGAPPSDKEEEWFAGVVKHLKSCFQGPPACDEAFLAQNERDLLCPRLKKAIAECGANKWTDLVISVKGEVKK